MSPALTSKITPYQAQWPDMYRREAARLGPVFGSVMTAIHHIGSTAVPDLAAKPEIDILVVVSAVSDAESWTEKLASLQYRRGGDLSPGHLFFKRDIEGVRTHKIHVCPEHHPKVHEMLSFRGCLRQHDDVRDEYQTLKLELERTNVSGIGEYLKGKEPFIEAVLKRTLSD